RSTRDWSSDVCSSDLGLMSGEILRLPGDDGEGIVDFVPGAGGELGEGGELLDLQPRALARALLLQGALKLIHVVLQSLREHMVRSEERRVGKAGRTGG